jgi:hypothetical protein
MYSDANQITHEEDDYSPSTVTPKLSSRSNALLTKSAQRVSRSKKSEAELRLADHLERFKSITEIGQVTNWDE